jgi:hypothetical protein
MAKKTNETESTLLCLIGFVIGAVLAAFFTGTSNGGDLVPEKIEWLFDSSELTVRQCWKEEFEPTPETEVLQ